MALAAFSPLALHRRAPGSGLALYRALGGYDVEGERGVEEQIAGAFAEAQGIAQACDAGLGGTLWEVRWAGGEGCLF